MEWAVLVCFDGDMSEIGNKERLSVKLFILKMISREFNVILLEVLKGVKDRFESKFKARIGNKTSSYEAYMAFYNETNSLLMFQLVI